MPQSPSQSSINKLSQSRKPTSKSRTKSASLKTKSLTPGVIDAQSKRFDPLSVFKEVIDVDALPEVPACKPSREKSVPQSKIRTRTKEPDAKGKGKQYEEEDNRLWVDLYEPTTEAELAVHVKKVASVRTWMKEALEGEKLRKYRRILVLTGPAGTGKTSTVKVLAREMGLDIMEWRNETSANKAPAEWDDYGLDHYAPSPQEAFSTFMTRASRCRDVFSSTARPHIILLEDLPNILHPAVQNSFHESLLGLVRPSDVPLPPIIIVVSDAGLRGTDIDESSARYGKDTVIDVRTILPKELFNGPFVTEIPFNPIAPTLMTRALKAMLAKRPTQPSADFLETLVATANGDIRSAIMALQFTSVASKPGKKGKIDRAVLEAVTRREQSLVLFHLLGKILYNKRKGDAPAPSHSAKDIQKDRDLDKTLKNPAPLPPWLSEHDRKASRVNVDEIYADAPIDSSLMSLYIHQNYTPFCEDVDQCEGVSEWLSWVDSSGGEAWYQANPHRFHLLALGTMHSLPTPVPRKGHKQYKPYFFEALSKEKDAYDGVRDVRSWLEDKWSRTDVITGLGGVLKARDSGPLQARAPSSHRLFTQLKFMRGAAGDEEQLQENEVAVEEEATLDSDQQVDAGYAVDEDRQDGGWLESDDIEDF
ncbi:Rad17 cell cycle checkpoint protein-domain-containing protein [Schizophyllum amplum]|uniref:Rad17 cell cycle checkpoint protein-domain-containing protein n=1 Tax=Schizophyllum amplum TaxID=97359 RepID=A0A550C1A2_9AGAR|nr:Rad17 cell cycle checkpoint protein-domain-containing protein [Auriculariopsis ampla]